MPPASPGTLGAPAYADILAYILQGNGATPGASALPRARELTPVSSGAPGEVKRNATQLTVRVKVETVWLSPAAVSTHT